jgi:hypothetical protein
MSAIGSFAGTLFRLWRVVFVVLLFLVAAETGLAESVSAYQLPEVSITIDGNFDDWQTIQPVFETTPTDSANAVIDKVYLAIDSSNLYMRFDIKNESHIASPFGANHELITYGVEIKGVNCHIWVCVYTTRTAAHWVTQIGTYASDSTGFGPVDSSRKYAMKGSSVEASFPLKIIRDKLGVLLSGVKYSAIAYAAFKDGRINKPFRTDEKKIIVESTSDGTFRG